MPMVRRFGLYACSILVVVVVRLALWITKYQKLRTALVRTCQDDPQSDRLGTVVHTLRAVEHVAKYVPDASCLTQSISGQILLSWRGIPTIISMGVLQNNDGSLDVHAWLVWNGSIVLQGNETSVAKYSKILDLPTPCGAPPARI